MENSNVLANSRRRSPRRSAKDFSSVISLVQENDKRLEEEESDARRRILWQQRIKSTPRKNQVFEIGAFVFCFLPIPNGQKGHHPGPCMDLVRIAYFEKEGEHFRYGVKRLGETLQGGHYFVYQEDIRPITRESIELYKILRRVWRYIQLSKVLPDEGDCLLAFVGFQVEEIFVDIVLSEKCIRGTYLGGMEQTVPSSCLIEDNELHRELQQRFNTLIDVHPPVRNKSDFNWYKENHEMVLENGSDMKISEIENADSESCDNLLEELHHIIDTTRQHVKHLGEPNKFQKSSAPRNCATPQNGKENNRKRKKKQMHKSKSTKQFKGNRPPKTEQTTFTMTNEKTDGTRQNAPIVPQNINPPPPLPQEIKPLHEVIAQQPNTTLYQKQNPTLAQPNLTLTNFNSGIDGASGEMRTCKNRIKRFNFNKSHQEKLQDCGSLLFALQCLLNKSHDQTSEKAVLDTLPTVNGHKNSKKRSNILLPSAMSQNNLFITEKFTEPITSKTSQSSKGKRDFSKYLSGLQGIINESEKKEPCLSKVSIRKTRNISSSAVGHVLNGTSEFMNYSSREKANFSNSTKSMFPKKRHSQLNMTAITPPPTKRFAPPPTRTPQQLPFLHQVRPPQESSPYVPPKAVMPPSMPPSRSACSNRNRRMYRFPSVSQPKKSDDFYSSSNDATDVEMLSDEENFPNEKNSRKVMKTRRQTFCTICQYDFGSFDIYYAHLAKHHHAVVDSFF